ncbi:hypothetical protein CFN78_27875 [Amycolatopsis antarctica]|uniref:Uncharacterized protein n=2 Tax=Amycolatopsis antarctica TaxID=1854586 RepID=A0A263CV24_9PSEU|nr:hypothetical protein CFN78_27875 [Amycolatopsis antarctica]
MTALAVGSMLAVLSGGAAAAASEPAPLGPRVAGEQVLQLRDELTRAAYAGDVTATGDTLGRLTPLLADMSSGRRYAIAPESRDGATMAKGQAEELTGTLAAPATRAQVPPVPTLPPLPGALAPVTGLLQGLLSTLSGLLAGLLGTVPALPVPVPEVPVPDVPLPEAPLPDAPLPQAPVPAPVS